ncbi:hypothetical protein ZEAMMB73_Zm00001d035204 [Zea mays]|uniref:Uncharacterized protein n=1 Tax=Zea mays TaxID=4577 RepID=A0A1D6LF00_MAIZE|nr:hypothetical protein ZEAMMB73_Zm00001d035204 [Zea mays]
MAGATVGAGARAATPGHPSLLPDGACCLPSLCCSDRAEVVNNDGGVAQRNKSDDDMVVEAFCVKWSLATAQEKVTKIEMVVKPLRKHGSKKIHQFVYSLIE